MFAFELWREFKLSIAEISKIFPTAKIAYVSKEILILDNIDKDEFERYLDYETEWNIYNSASDSFQTLARVLDLKPTDYILRDDSNR